MMTRRIPKERIGREELLAVINDWDSSVPFTLIEERDEWVLVFTNSGDGFDDALNQHIGFGRPGLPWATIEEITVGAVKPLRVKRGQYSLWCYVTKVVADLLGHNGYAVGDRVLVCFADGRRDLPVVVG